MSHQPQLDVDIEDAGWQPASGGRAGSATRTRSAVRVEPIANGGAAASAPHIGPARAHPLPRVDYLATGGTIASVRSGPVAGAVPSLTAEAIAQSVGGIDAFADLRTGQFAQRPSTSISFADLLGLRDEILRRVQDGSAGIVITQGTDTLEETAFALDLLWAGPAPIVITGAMRNPSLPGADGPANLLAAVQVAASPTARGLGALVVFNDEIHAARFVSKTHTSRLSAFRSRTVGPIGWLTEGRPVIAAAPVGRFHLTVPSDVVVPPVALIRLALGDDGRILPALAGLGFRGAVIEGFGGGHVTPRMVPLLEDLAAEMPVVLASRTGSGEVLTSTYRYLGSEIGLLELGLIRAGALDGLKARLLLSLCLAADPSAAIVENAFEALGMTSGPVVRGREETGPSAPGN
jgi:L-asparaginase